MKEFNALIGRFQSIQDRLDYRAALVSAVIANTARDAKRTPKAFAPEDFMPVSKSKRQTASQMFAHVQMLNSMFGGKVQEN